MRAQQFQITVLFLIFVPAFWLLKKYEYNTSCYSDFVFQLNRIHEQKHIQLRP